MVQMDRRRRRKAKDSLLLPRRLFGEASTSSSFAAQVVQLLMILFAVLWLLGLIVSHAFLQQHLEKDPEQEEEDEPDPNPYFGWQPDYPSNDAFSTSSECHSWRVCFPEPEKAPPIQCLTRCREQEWDEPAPDPPENWIPDVTVLYRMRLAGKDSNGRPWPPPLDPELCQEIGPVGGKHDDNKKLLDVVPIQAQHYATSLKPSGAKILCMVYTHDHKHVNSVRAIRETWASGCDGFLAFSNVTDPRIPAISIPHDGEESYDNMWQKVRSIWKFAGEHYLEQFDFFYLGGEDLFVLPQNLKVYLASLGDPEQDHFVGRRFKGHGKNNYFNSGGSGYALSRGTLRKYVYQGYDDSEHCSVTAHTSMEDVMMGACLRKAFGIGLTDTRDDQLRERFHPFAPAKHYYWKPDPNDWYMQYNREWPPLLKEKCCAPDSVSFHYIKKAAMMRHLQALLYECPNER
mmetsp:Transcript_28119/g.77328  ORF Transcript_28119/g.77328 Transcript_28119/m.77328 type:complete len:458 (-) Transcript_28119:361-1734(-)